MNVIDRMILAYLKNNEFYEETTDYQKVIEHFVNLNWDENIIESHVDDLLDTGMIYEPLLGKLRVT